MSGNLYNYDDPHRKYETRVQLTIQKGRAKNLIRDVTGPVFTLGTDHSCDMVLGDTQFPDVHSYVCIREGVVSLRHLGQGPPVTVNGRSVRWGELRDGDRIRTGSYEFRVSVNRELSTERKPRDETTGSNAFAGKLGQLPAWWSSVTDLPINWDSLSANMSSLSDRRFGPQEN